MALPVLEKIWQFNVNQKTVTSGVILTDLQALMYKIKASMVGFGSSPWVVISSCDGASVSASDLWTAPNKLLWGPTGARSWIVLQQAGLSANFQICIELYPSNGVPHYVSWIGYSQSAGFINGGTINARPTATDEVTLLTNAEWINGFSPADTVLHVMQSTTGENLRIAVCIASSLKILWIFDKLENSYITIPVLCSLKTGSPTPSIGNYLSSNYMYGTFGSTNFNAYLTSEKYNNYYVFEGNGGIASQFSSAYPMAMVGAYSETVSAKGHCGRFADMWAGSPNLALGSTYPAIPDNKQFIQLNQFIFPWDGSTPVIF